MGHITTHTTKSGERRYRARYRDATGREHTKRGFTRKKDAQAFLTQQENAVNRGGHVAPSAGRETFEQYAERWRVVQKHRTSTADLVRRHFTNHVYPVLGDVPLARIDKITVQGMLKRMSATLADGTVTMIYRYVAAVFRSAVDDALIAKSPCAGIKRERPKSRPVVPITTGEVQALIDASPAHVRALVVVAATTGLRQGELFGLTVDRLDLLHRRVRVDRQLVSVAGAPPEFGPLKTDASYRTVPLPQVAVDALAEHLDAYPAVPTALVFRNVHGNAHRRSAFFRTWHDLTRRAGVSESMNFHALRHYYASLLIHGGESVKTVQARLGHASASETLDTYSHLFPESDDRTRDVIDNALGGAVRAATTRPLDAEAL